MKNDFDDLLTQPSPETVYFAEVIDSDDEILFADETPEEKLSESWKILVVDDEAQVHTATEISLRKFVFENKSLTFINAYSAREAKQLIQENPDVAIILLDVIMETDDAGLNFVKYVREVLGNQLVRIILRTGQPGQVPEKSIIINYDINDYKTKTELTTSKLYTTMLTALRSFSLSQNLLSEIERREQVEKALRISEEKEHQKSVALEHFVKELQETQLQLVQSEKMSSLGQLVAGVAHEINNPVNFIYGNLSHANDYIKELINMLNLYQRHYPQPEAEIIHEIEDAELPFIIDDLPKLLSSMQLGIERIRNIVHSLRNFSRLDETEIKSVDIHEGINSTLMILQHRLKAKSDRPAINVIKDYGALPLVNCYAGQLNQVFMNLLANAIDA
ncbi:hybrid sensor histidine kinase/response regulator, partial [Microcoleus sp. herbarium5]